MSLLSSTKTRDERGAYAVLVGVLAIVLIGFAAIAVDIGNAVARKSDVQGQADFGALAAGHDLSAMKGSIPNTVLQAVADSMNENSPLGGECSGSGCVTVATLATCGAGDTDGCVEFVTVNGVPALQVTAPEERVDYGLARVLGFDGVDVQAKAAIRIGSPLGTVPFYAVDGCDEGPQTIADPAPGHGSGGAVPTLAFDGDDNRTDLSSASPMSVSLNPATQPEITIQGIDFDDTRSIGFFRTDDTTAAAVITVNLPSPVTGTGPIVVTVPDAVTDYEHVWYIRSYSGALAAPGPSASQWSPRDDALPFRVGTAFLNCGSLANEGNFGTLQLNRDDVTSEDDQIAKNLATTLQIPLSLDKHDGADPLTGTCSDGSAGAIESPGSERNPFTNCVDTKTGLPANAATQGLVTGVDGEPGRLDRADTTPGCDPSKGNSERNLEFNPSIRPGPDYSVNDDVLSCFMLDASMPISALTSWNEADGAALDNSIYKSPRMIFVPVLHKEPLSGGSLRYSIKGFRPGFITGQTGAETKTSGGSADENGVIVSGQRVIQVNVFFFDISALPSPPPGTDLTDYMGEGPKVIQMIN